MPIYEYECEKCGQVEEAFQKMSDAPLSTCRHCSGALHKILSQSSFHLKGSGWYVTDYGGSSSRADASSSKKTDAGTSCGAAACSKKPVEKASSGSDTPK